MVSVQDAVSVHKIYRPSNEVKARRKELLDMARKACRKFGGQAEIGDGYVIVDTSKFKVEER